MNAPPLQTDTLELCLALQRHFDPIPEQTPLRRRIQSGVLALVDYITLTVCDIDRRDNLRAADAELQTLRIHLELACELELLESDHMIECEDRIHHIGRQIGGWLRSLNSATIPAGSSEC